jgi:flagellin-like hook-associated protein FlgL
MDTGVMTKIDVLGALLAQIADLQADVDQIKDELKDAATSPGGAKVFEGTMFRATVVSSDRKQINYGKMIKDLKIDDDVVAKYSSTVAVFAVRTTAR